MEAFNAASILTPLSVFTNRTTKHPRKFSSPPTISASKFTNFSGSSTKKPRCLQECLSGGLLLAASPAAALTYEEALGQSLSSPGSSFSVDFDSNGVVESVLTFASENPLVIGGAVAFLAVPLVLSQVLRKPNKAWGVESAKNAYAKLGADGNAELVDIRGAVEVRKVGVPDVGGLGKKSVSIGYKGDDKPGFLKKLALKFKEPENTTLFILDKFNGNSELVAELVTVNGFKAAYAIKDGAEGPRGWMNSGLPWIAPRKTFRLDFGNLTDALGDTSDGLAVILGIAAATGLGLLVFSEIETILQVLGSVALVQFASKLLFAEDRKQTLQQVDEFLNTKVAPKELVDDIKQIGMAFLPASMNSKTLPAPADTASESKVDAVAAGPALGINSVPKAKIKDESLPVLPRPLSPYPYYSDFKPPTSPTPLQPKIKDAADTTSSSQVVATAAGPAPEVNSVPKTEINDESLPVLPRSLSPYPYYSDFKPPTSPTPSQS